MSAGWPQTYKTTKYICDLKKNTFLGLFKAFLLFIRVSYCDTLKAVYIFDFLFGYLIG